MEVLLFIFENQTLGPDNFVTSTFSSWLSLMDFLFSIKPLTVKYSGILLEIHSWRPNIGWEMTADRQKIVPLSGNKVKELYPL